MKQKFFNILSVVALLFGIFGMAVGVGAQSGDIVLDIGDSIIWEDGSGDVHARIQYDLVGSGPYDTKLIVRSGTEDTNEDIKFGHEIRLYQDNVIISPDTYNESFIYESIGGGTTSGGQRQVQWEMDKAGNQSVIASPIPGERFYGNVVPIQGEKQWDGVTIYQSSGWNTQALASWTTEVPDDATGIFVRVAGNNNLASSSCYLAFSGDEGSTKEIAALLRSRNDTPDNNDDSFYLPLDDFEFYYRVNDYSTCAFTYVYLVVVGYTFK